MVKKFIFSHHRNGMRPAVKENWVEVPRPTMVQELDLTSMIHPCTSSNQFTMTKSPTKQSTSVRKEGNRNSSPLEARPSVSSVVDAVLSTGNVQSNPKWASAKQKYDNSARDSIQDPMATTIQHKWGLLLPRKWYPVLNPRLKGMSLGQSLSFP